MANVYFKYGNQAKYDSLINKDPYTLYWISDTQRLYKGEDLYSIGTLATEKLPGLMSEHDKAKLNSLIQGVTKITNPDNSLLIGEDEELGVSVKVKLSDIPDNYIQLKKDGLAVEIPMATEILPGITKVYQATGQNTDGTMSQQAITNELDDKIEMNILEHEETLVLGYDIN